MLPKKEATADHKTMEVIEGVHKELETYPKKDTMEVKEDTNRSR
jgi:hypothetical protein